MTWSGCAQPGFPVIRTLDEALTTLRRMFTVGLGWPEPAWLAEAERAWRTPLGRRAAARGHSVTVTVAGTQIPSLSAYRILFAICAVAALLAALAGLIVTRWNPAHAQAIEAESVSVG